MIHYYRMEGRRYNALGICACALACALVLIPNTMRAAEDALVLTEVMYNLEGGDSAREWIELYNAGSLDVAIVEGSGNGSWRLYDGSNHILSLAQGSATIPPGGFVIFASDAPTFLSEHPAYGGTLFDTVMALSNTTETVKVSSDAGDTYFTTLTYQNTWGGDGDGYTIEKIVVNNDNSASNWRPGETTNGSPGFFPSHTEEQQPAPTSPGQTTGQSTPQPEQPILLGNPEKIKISELLPNPAGEDWNEYIEIWNSGSKTTTLHNWKLGDSSKIISLPDIALVPDEHRAFMKSETGLSLNNNTDRVVLYDMYGTLIDEISYTETKEDYSFSLNPLAGKFRWTPHKTPYEHNDFSIPNSPPSPVITLNPNPAAPLERVTLSGNHSSDPENDALTYVWHITKGEEISGDTYTYRFGSVGKHLITLMLSDGYHTTSTSTEITILPPEDIISLRMGDPVSSELKEQIVEDGYEYIHITEILPNPRGDDITEWIELTNMGDFAVDLTGVYIDDSDGGSKPYALNNIIMDPGAYLVLNRERTKLMLNNTSDEVRLLTDDRVIESVPYDDPPEEKSYSLDEQKEIWYWNNSPTPGSQNIITTPSRDDTYIQFANSNDFKNEAGDAINIDLPYIRELEIGTRVKVQGVVSVEPGILGKTYFYIVGSQGVQVYFSKKDWPQLTLGDSVGIIGTLSETGGETRVKIADKNDIIFLYQSDEPQPIAIQSSQIGESTEGSLVTIMGELVEKASNTWFVADQEGEARVVFQQTAHITKPDISAGQRISITGMVSETKSGYRILPRYSSDIIVSTEEQGAVLGEHAAQSSAGSTVIIPSNNTPRTIAIYGAISTTGIGVILCALLFRLRRETKRRLNELEQKQKHTD